MPSTLRKAKLTVTLSGDVVNEIDAIAKEKGTPRSQVMEKILREWLLKFKKIEIERDIEKYYLSLTEKEKEEEKEWRKLSTENAKRIWNE